MNKAYIGLGSNAGNKLSNLKKAISILRKKCGITKVSPFYKTEPVGYKSQGWFLNCAAEIRTKLPPEKLLKFLKSIEKSLKRKKAVRHGPRTIDLDILFYGDVIIKTKNLAVPHQRLHKRLFVLEPLYRINPRLLHPKLKKTIKELRNGIKSRQAVELYKP